MHTDGFTLEWNVCCKGYLQLQVALCVNPSRLQGISFSSVPQVCVAVGCSVNAYQDKTSLFFTVCMRVSLWLASELQAHSPAAAAIDKGSLEAALAQRESSLSVWQKHL